MNLKGAVHSLSKGNAFTFNDVPILKEQANRKAGSRQYLESMQLKKLEPNMVQLHSLIKGTEDTPLNVLFLGQCLYPERYSIILTV